MTGLSRLLTYLQVVASLAADVSASRLAFVGVARAYATRCIVACSGAWAAAPSLALLVLVLLAVMV